MEQEQDKRDVTITYDTLFEILRNEKNKEDPYKLHDTFFEDVVGYLNEKQKIVEEKKEQQSLFDSNEKEKTIHQITNIKKILRDIYERREKKIINMAINKSRFNSNAIDTSVLLSEEKMFYDLLVSLLDSQRDRLLNALLNGRSPLIEIKNLGSTIEANQEKPKEDFQSADTLPEKTKLVRFLTAVPQFMGEDLREYGPYDEEDVAKLPDEIASLLIGKERAEEIKEN